MNISLNTIKSVASSVVSKATPIKNQVSNMVTQAESFAPKMEKLTKKDYMQYIAKVFKQATNFVKKGYEFAKEYGSKAIEVLQTVFQQLKGLIAKAPKTNA